MQHRVEATRREHRRHRALVGDIELFERELRVRPKPLEPRALERWIVIAVQVVDAQHVVPALKQAGTAVHANETCDARDEKLHAGPGLKSRTAATMRCCVA